MSEFKLHTLISDLIVVLESSHSPEKFIENIPLNAITLENIPSKNSICYLEKNSVTNELFLKKYNELKGKKIDGLGSFIQVLYHISLDKSLKNYLAKYRIKNNLKLPSSFTITNDDLPTIHKNILKAANEREKQATKKMHGFNRPTETSVIKYNWCSERPKITWDYYSDIKLNPYLRVVPAVSQETILIWDLLNCLKGIDGNYIVSEPLSDINDRRTFTISTDVSTPYKQLVQQILPLASCYSTTIRFVEDKILPNDGQVNHALRGAMNYVLKDYLLFIVQLEMEHLRHKLNLQNLWFYIQPIMSTMSILAQMTTILSKAQAKGGKVLSLLYEQINNMSGEAKCKELGLFLIESASLPYMQILEKWVYKGVICDPYQEFFVEDNELIQREELPMDYSADYWEKRYTMKSERIPSFLNQHAHTILRTGKYFNVIRQCGKMIKWIKQEPLIYHYRDQKLIFTIDQAYNEAARTLLEVLIHENDLMGRLKSVKNYFLLSQGDFVVQFLNLCENELSKNMYDIVIHRLASLLEVSLRTSTADLDPYKDDLKPELLPYDLQFQMFRILSIQTSDEKEFAFQAGKRLDGIEAFAFNYDVKWPVSLVINRKAIACYQMLFRHLFSCKHIERLLCRVWISNKIAKTFTHTAAMAYRQAFSLRHRMLDCIQHLEYYMMVEVIEPNWQTFISKMSKVTNVDDVLTVHQDLQDSYLKECMLTDPELLSSITGICNICKQFCNFIQENKTKSIVSGSFKETIELLDVQFTDALHRLLNRIITLGCNNDFEKLLNVLCRLDFNLFYTDLMADKSSEVTQQYEISG
ncbi:gamma-tubulin complex component 2-like isoform X2 [Microplitis mediator]|uniref:gamma-tubulin complex component 2-like isoform X2 n=1 Tax=Microplitis mediator TaxID=375433 RepID=UPI0025538ED1|nr:gamma-tubulin complex component 2-like isoform X2 [Microplitis mediator]